MNQFVLAGSLITSVPSIATGAVQIVPFTAIGEMTKATPVYITKGPKDRTEHWASCAARIEADMQTKGMCGARVRGVNEPAFDDKGNLVCFDDNGRFVQNAIIYDCGWPVVSEQERDHLIGLADSCIITPVNPDLAPGQMGLTCPASVSLALSWFKSSDDIYRTIFDRIKGK